MTQVMSGFDRINYCADAMPESADGNRRNLKFFGFFDNFIESGCERGDQLDWNVDGFEVRNAGSKSNKDFCVDENVTNLDIMSLMLINKFDVKAYDFTLNLKEKRRFFKRASGSRTRVIWEMPWLELLFYLRCTMEAFICLSNLIAFWLNPIQIGRY